MKNQKVTYSAVTGLVIANERKQKGLEQNDMADALGLSQASYSRLESGKATFSIDQVYLASRKIEVPMDELIAKTQKYCNELMNQGIEVEGHIRGNASKASEQSSDGAKFLAGAALGAVVMALIAGR